VLRHWRENYPRHRQAQGARDHADVFCTTEEGVKGKRADWAPVDEVVAGSKLEETVAARAKEFTQRARGGLPPPCVASPLKRELGERR
jgi:benzoyl-CoA-dihydrodiol lyase